MSEDQDESSKTEEASGRKLEKAHEEGQFAMSREVNNLLAMIAILIIVGWFVAPIMGNSKGELSHFLSEGYQIPTDQEGIRMVLSETMIDIIYYAGLPLILLMVMGILATTLQSDFDLPGRC